MIVVSSKIVSSFKKFEINLFLIILYTSNSFPVKSLGTFVVGVIALWLSTLDVSNIDFLFFISKILSLSIISIIF